MICPADPVEQLQLAVIAVFDSWNSSRAEKYRNINQITGLKGTAVNVQAMVFGNMGADSGTGVLFTRNPSTGEKKLYGEYLINAQVCNNPELCYLGFQLFCEVILAGMFCIKAKHSWRNGFFSPSKIWDVIMVTLHFLC